MNNPSYLTIVGWQTRNWRNNKKAIQYCKNYGLKPILKNLFVGKLYTREYKLLKKKMNLSFAKKTDNFTMFLMCKTCFENADIDDTIKNNVTHISDFEILQFPEITQ